MDATPGSRFGGLAHLDGVDSTPGSGCGGPAHLDAVDSSGKVCGSIFCLVMKNIFFLHILSYCFVCLLAKMLTVLTCSLYKSHRMFRATQFAC